MTVASSLLHSGDVVVFQGDSLTDAGRNREVTGPNALGDFGAGYASRVAETLLALRPADGLRTFNRGVGGDTIHHLDARWRLDAIDLQPSLLSVLIGVNDTWRHVDRRGPGSDLDAFDRIYRSLLDQSLEANPRLRLVLGEPFVLPCGAWSERWFPEFTDRQAIVREIARDCARDTGDPSTSACCRLVPYQSLFDAAMQLQPDPAWWAGDGVHPTPPGHTLMARAWLAVVLHGADATTALRP